MFCGYIKTLITSKLKIKRVGAIICSGTIAYQRNNVCLP